MFLADQYGWEQPIGGGSLSASAAPFAAGPTGAGTGEGGLSASAAPYIPGTLAAHANEGGLSASAAPYVPTGDGASASRGPKQPSPAVINLATALSPAMDAEDQQVFEASTMDTGESRRTAGPVGAGAGQWTPKVTKKITKDNYYYAQGKRGPMEETPHKADKVGRATLQLRQLLDFYFEPFNLQHNRYLLDLIARRTKQQPDCGPLLAELLEDFRFSFDDLMGLGRIAAALGKLRQAQCESLGPLKHVRWTGDGRLQLRSPPEVRKFVAARSASPASVSKAMQYLVAVREQRGKAPAGMVSICSYVVAEPLADDSNHGSHRQGQLKRQLIVHRADIMCLMGMDPTSTTGSGITQALTEEGYNFAWARNEHGEANAIFYDWNRFALVGHREVGADLAVDLHPWHFSEEKPKSSDKDKDKTDTLRVICTRPEVPMIETVGPNKLFAERPPGGSLVVCADMTLLGGAENAVVSEELCGLKSLAHEVLGDELFVPLSSPSGEDGRPGPARAPASKLNRLHCPDGMLYEGLFPLIALSGHSEQYMATLGFEETIQQFPAFRIPIVAAFQLPFVDEPMETAQEPPPVRTPSKVPAPYQRPLGEVKRPEALLKTALQ